jgi:hypothetical protein
MVLVHASRVTTHLGEKHSVPSRERKELGKILMALLQTGFRALDAIPLWEDGSLEDPFLQTQDKTDSPAMDVTSAP